MKISVLEIRWNPPGEDSRKWWKALGSDVLDALLYSIILAALGHLSNWYWSSHLPVSAIVIAAFVAHLGGRRGR